MVDDTPNAGFLRPLGRTGLEVSAIGLGLAALGRPGYLNLGHAEDLAGTWQDGGHDVEALRHRTGEVLDAAWAAGVRYVDVARSYGRAEEFLGSWLRRLTTTGAGTVVRPVVGSKWGYTYTAGWRTDAEVHEVKEHSVENFRRQLAETRAELGDGLDLYQIHSATFATGVLDDEELLDELATLKASGTAVGLSVSGADQGAVVDAALEIRRDGMLLFDTVQATWNVLEPSAGPALARAHDAGLGVIVKEGVANGRLTPRGDFADPGTPLGAVALVHDTTVDAVALAAVHAQDFVDVVLSGAATVAHLHANLAATGIVLTPAELDALADLAEDAEDYWAARSDLPWQ